MSPEPASLNSQAAIDPRGVIGLFLAKLFEYLVGLQTSGQTAVPKDIAIMVRSAEAMVNSVIRSLTVRQLKRAGYTYAARALRDREALRDARRSAQSTSGPEMDSASTEDLLDRLTTTIENFERADELADQLARMIVCSFLFAFPGLHERPAPRLSNVPGQHAPRRVGLGPPTIIPVGQGPPYTWPPLDPGPPPGTAGDIRPSPSTSFSGLRKQDRDPETRLILLRFKATALSPTHRETPDLIRGKRAVKTKKGITSDRAGAAPLRRSRRNGASKYQNAALSASHVRRSLTRTIETRSNATEPPLWRQTRIRNQRQRASSPICCPMKPIISLNTSSRSSSSRMECPRRGNLINRTSAFTRSSALFIRSL